MTRPGDQPELLYIHTGLIAALLLHLGRVDLEVGGCGTGQGFLNAVVQYPGVVCGLIHTPLDAWLFAQINAGNCLSLALNQGYGWAGGVNLRFIFDRLFEIEWGSGYPPHRQEPQRCARQVLGAISTCTHRPFAEILAALTAEVARPALTYPGIADLLDPASIPDPALHAAISGWI